MIPLLRILTVLTAIFVLFVVCVCICTGMYALPLLIFVIPAVLVRFFSSHSVKDVLIEFRKLFT